MGMDVDTGGKGKGAKPEMNVTPLVDIVLVLLIIFMVISPVVTKGLFVNLPPKPDDEVQQQMNRDLKNETITLWVREDGAVWLNKQYKFGDGEAPKPKDPSAEVTELPLDDLPPRLDRVLNTRENRVVYLDAQDDVDFRQVIDTIDRARRAGAQPIVMLTEPVKE